LHDPSLQTANMRWVHSFAKLLDAMGNRTKSNRSTTINQSA
jgi:hypothetical protein